MLKIKNFELYRLSEIEMDKLGTKSIVTCIRNIFINIAVPTVIFVIVTSLILYTIVTGGFMLNRRPVPGVQLETSLLLSWIMFTVLYELAFSVALGILLRVTRFGAYFKTLGYKYYEGRGNSIYRLYKESN